MSAKVRIVDPEKGNTSVLDSRGNLATAVTPFPPEDRFQPVTIFRDFLRDSGGSNDMRVAASLTSPTDFFISATPNTDLYVVTVSFLIADSGAVLNNFGNISALTNGCQIFWEKDDGPVNISGSLQSNFDFIRLGLGTPAFGDGNTVFRINNAVGSSEGYTPNVDLRLTFGLPWGLRLIGGTNQRFFLRVRDNTTGVDGFNCIVNGFTRSVE